MFYKITLLALLILTYLSVDMEAFAIESIRSQEIKECRSNELVTWGDGRDRPAGVSLLKFTYNPKGAPDWFAADQAAEMVAKAVEAWSQCGVRTQFVAWDRSLEKQRDIVRITWDEKESGGNFGLTNFKRRTLSLGPKAFELLKTRNPTYDSRETLQMTISHEMGHFFGLMEHSKRCIDVLSYYTDGKGGACFSRDPLWKRRVIEYRSALPTACDIERCRKINGNPPL